MGKGSPALDHRRMGNLAVSDLPPARLDLRRCQLSNARNLPFLGHFPSTYHIVADMGMQKIHELQTAPCLQQKGSRTHPTASPTPLSLETGRGMEVPDIGSITSVLALDGVADMAACKVAMAETTGPEREGDPHVSLVRMPTTCCPVLRYPDVLSTQCLSLVLLDVRSRGRLVLAG